MKRFLAGALALLACLALPACERAPAADPEAAQKEQRYLEAMDTFMTLTACGAHRSEALDAVEAEIRRLEALLSIGSPDSEISKLNRAGAATLSADSRALVARSLELWQQTGGRFDISVLPLMELWGFTSGNYHVPTQEELDSALARVGADRMTFDPDSGRLTLAPGQEIDLGGIAKGYTSQRAMALFRAAGVTSALVSLGGNVQCLGARPDGTPWRIGIQAPWGAEGAMSAIVEVTDRAVVTSGGYERYFTDEATGKTYRHILDPATGCPAESGLASVTIVAPDGALADGLSTALYIMGLDAATEYWRAHSGEFEAILIDDGKRIYVTEGLAASVRPAAGMDQPTVLKRQG